ncbi:helix-turn-helix domain-containing protein [Haloarchaeobius amylolyticus]|uniref:helix-turn-helix domain-containing protein n=1 Tax=Haloarchaeobius amylolyticus TaxID=1198296 RepID=UPI00226F0064|nr:helix-turn-helix domain-containing protein [Haloarchaeobius amylolyticus]
MTVSVEFAVEASSLGLGDTLRRFPDAVLEVDQVGRTDRGTVELDFWVRNVDVADFRAALADDGSVGKQTHVCDHDRWALLSVTLTDAVLVSLYDLLLDLDGQLLSATCRDAQWRARFRFPDREDMATFEAHLSDSAVSASVEAVASGPCEQHVTRRVTLSDDQREALRVALAAGYFSVPREANLGDVAEELGISGQAASERLRRGLSELVDRQVGEDPRNH